MPRCGTDLLQHYLQDTRSLNFAGEFLTFNNLKYDRAEKIADTGNFTADHIIKEVSEFKYDFFDHQKFAEIENKRRLEFIHEYSQKWGPVVVKSFVNTFYHQRLFLEVICDNYDIVILSRRNKWLSILSYFICMETGIWHAYESEQQIQKSKEIINNIKLEINENLFYYQVMHQNFLTTLQMNIHQFNKDAISLYFEDFEDDPVTQLNTIFKTTMRNPMLNFNKLTKDHESKIINIDALRKIYNKYILKI